MTRTARVLGLVSGKDEGHHRGGGHRFARTILHLGIRINGTNDHPGFQGFNLTDPLKIESKAKIDLMAAELGTARTGVAAAHATVRDPRINLYPLFYDTSHGVLKKEWALGSDFKGRLRHVPFQLGSRPDDRPARDPATYSEKSVGFFDGSKEMLQNGMMQMATYDCDNPYVFSMMTRHHQRDLHHGLHRRSPVWRRRVVRRDRSRERTRPPARRTARSGMCKQMIGGKLAQSMGMPRIPMMRMDGVEFMQMMAIREGAVAEGCNPMMQIFGLPTRLRSDGHQLYSRDEIRQHFAKSMQQSFFTPVRGRNDLDEPGHGRSEPVPSTLGRVFGISTQIVKNPGNPNHVNKFDFGATCRNPMTGRDIPLRRFHAGIYEPHQYRGKLKTAAGVC